MAPRVRLEACEKKKKYLARVGIRTPNRRTSNLVTVKIQLYPRDKSLYLCLYELFKNAF
jgi:hypothetical protein